MAVHDLQLQVHLQTLQTESRNHLRYDNSECVDVLTDGLATNMALAERK
jgi:hypothetical protein